MRNDAGMRLAALRGRPSFENYYVMRADQGAFFIAAAAPGPSATVAAKVPGGFMGLEVAPILDAQETMGRTDAAGR
jgi:hypothetical protein